MGQADFVMFSQYFTLPAEYEETMQGSYLNIDLLKKELYSTSFPHALSNSPVKYHIFYDIVCLKNKLNVNNHHLEVGV